jgi:hypothetical protein
MEAEASTAFDEIAPSRAGPGGVMANKRGPKPRPAEERRGRRLIVGCRSDCQEWVYRFSKSERAAPSDLADQGLAALAHLRGFEVPPDR